MAAADAADRGRRLPAAVVVARVLRPHGVSGELVVQALGDNPQRLAPGSELLAAGTGRRLRVTAARAHSGRMLVCFDGIDGRDAAEALRGTVLEVERSRVPALPAGEYYHFELVGCRCRDLAAGELGEVVEVTEDGGGLLLIVDDGRRRVPVPFVRAFLRRVDVERGVIELELPEGLLDTCASTS